MAGTERWRGYRLEIVGGDFLAGWGEKSTPGEILMVIHYLVHLLPREYQARLPQLARRGGPWRFLGGVAQKLSKNSNLPCILWVGNRNKERRRMVGYQSFETYLEEKIPDSPRKSYYLMPIHDHLGQILAPEIEGLGWSKALELAKVARGEGGQFDCSTWLHSATRLHTAQWSTKEELKEAVHKSFTGEGYEAYGRVCFKLFESQLPVVERRLYLASQMVGTERSRGYCPELV
jgi:hypothetical protein